MVMVWLSYYIYRSCFLIIHPLTSLFAEPYLYTSREVKPGITVYKARVLLFRVRKRRLPEKTG